jgi:hypothetical protein
VLFIKGNSPSVTEIWKEEYELNLVLSLVQNNFFRLNCSVNDLCTSSAVTSGLNRETRSALDLSGFVITGKDCEMLAPMKSCLRGLALLAASISVGVLVEVFLL